jgi:hypothetical protein
MQITSDIVGKSKVMCVSNNNHNVEWMELIALLTLITTIIGVVLSVK